MTQRSVNLGKSSMLILSKAIREPDPCCRRDWRGVLGCFLYEAEGQGWTMTCQALSCSLIWRLAWQSRSPCARLPSAGAGDGAGPYAVGDLDGNYFAVTCVLDIGVQTWRVDRSRTGHCSARGTNPLTHARERANMVGVPYSFLKIPVLGNHVQMLTKPRPRDAAPHRRPGNNIAV